MKFRVIIAATAALALSACNGAQDVRLNSSKAFYAGQVALISAQETTLAVCSIPNPPEDACDKAVAILHKGAEAERVGFIAQQAGNASDLNAAISVLIEIPAALAELGILEKSIDQDN